MPTLHGFETQAWELCAVAQTFENDYDGDLVDITITLADGATETISVTDEHPFWVTNRTGRDGRPVVAFDKSDTDVNRQGHWTQARHLRLGDKLLTRSGHSATVTGYRVRTERLKVYNFEVEQLHNYAVGRASVLSHNMCARAVGNATRRAQTAGDRTFPSENAARRALFRDNDIRTSDPNNFTRTNQYGKNKNIRGDGGKPSEVVGARNIYGQNKQFEHHNHGHRYDDTNEFELPHYQGPNGEHYSYPFR